MTVESLDHLVLTVADLDATVAWYTRVLGVTTQTFGEGRRALVFGTQKINLHQKGHEFEPKAAHPTPGSGDLCFLTSDTMEATLAHLQEEGIVVEAGPVKRTGARGSLLSVYIRDPDQNLIEISREVAD